MSVDIAVFLPDELLADPAFNVWSYLRGVLEADYGSGCLEGAGYSLRTGAAKDTSGRTLAEGTWAAVRLTPPAEGTVSGQ